MPTKTSARARSSRQPPLGDANSKPRKFLTGPQVCARYAITDMSLWRWLHDPELGFPQPSLIVQRRRFWDENILRAWELTRVPPRSKAAVA